jgi:hypothetical protein
MLLIRRNTGLQKPRQFSADTSGSGRAILSEEKEPAGEVNLVLTPRKSVLEKEPCCSNPEIRIPVRLEAGQEEKEIRSTSKIPSARNINAYIIAMVYFGTFLEAEIKSPERKKNCNWICSIKSNIKNGLFRTLKD